MAEELANVVEYKRKRGGAASQATKVLTIN
jgi:hypothetical protein